MSFRIKYWGVRGSLPSAPSPEQWSKEIENILNDFFASGYRDVTQIREYLASKTVPQLGGFGSHTTCVEMNAGDTQVIIDGGSGLHNLGEVMMKGPAARGKGVFHILMTHFHWDHLLGIPFFAPHFVKGNKIHYYAVQPDLAQNIRIKFQKPMFPVPFESLPSEVSFHILEPRKAFQLGDFSITPYQLDHPDPCWGYRVEAYGKKYAHCVDTEGTRTTREALGLDLPLYQNADLMYFDAQYTLPELAEKANWGHSAAQLGLDIAFREKIKQVIFAHHDPGADTHAIYELKQQTEDYHNWKTSTARGNRVTLPSVKWRYAYEGLSVDLNDIS
ncbi:MAG: MBL fold metallo-hydrolase [Proteobacteria bacterium]|jgi:phosphoribosyl 1,2-cyclic phosphodiesterase|nr:MBL fold metallo-hydrolase [Pseudomonadota bacterium]